MVRLLSERTNHVSRMEGAWAIALGLSVNQVSGVVHESDNPEYRIDLYVCPGDQDKLPALFHRTSYLCKAATKSYGDRQRGFDTNRG